MPASPKNNGPRSEAELTTVGRTIFTQLMISAMKALHPAVETDYTLFNGIAAIHMEHTRILDRIGRSHNEESGVDDNGSDHETLGAPSGDGNEAPEKSDYEELVARIAQLEKIIRSNPVLAASIQMVASPNPIIMAPSPSPSNMDPSPSPSIMDPSPSPSIMDETHEDIDSGVSTMTLPNIPVVRWKRIFRFNTTKPIIRAVLPKVESPFDSTLQLAFGHHLLSRKTMPPIHAPGLLDITGGDAEAATLEEPEKAWVAAMLKHSNEQERVRWLTAQVAAEFFKTPYKDPTAVAEVLLLGHVFNRKDYRSVLTFLINHLKQEALLDLDLVRGIIQLLQDASPGYLIDDDFVRILQVLRQRLNDTSKALGDTEQPALDHSCILVTAISRALDSMIEGNFRIVNRTVDHDPLVDVLTELKDSSDPYLKFQASYAWQALQYVGDDESPLHTVLRFGGGMEKALLGVTSMLKFDTDSLCNGLYELGLATGQAYDIMKSSLEGAQAFRAGGHGTADSVLMGFQSGSKRLWYPALQGARVFVREGRLIDFERVINQASCRHESEFQWGVSQMLGEMAMDPIWEPQVRELAIDFLGNSYKSEGAWNPNPQVKNAILGILLRVCTGAEQQFSNRAMIILQDVTNDSVDTLPSPFPLIARLPPPTSSPLLDEVYSVSTIEYDIHRLRNLRGMEQEHSIYIPPFAKGSPSASDMDSVALMDKVREFLENDGQVLLIVGDPGSGKSTFNKYLERVLWGSYKPGDRIPLFINLPELKKPKKELIPELLRLYDFSPGAIMQLKCERRFVLICDGYDEARLTSNLHSTNSFNRPGQWNVKMIVSCRSTHVRRNYRSLFQPQPTTSYGRSLPHLFQEATIVPFSRNQIRDYIKQFVQEKEVHELFDGRPVWSAKEYMEKLEEIPNLVELVQNPFLLDLSLRVLPGIMKDRLDTWSISLTRSRILEAFVKQWLDINQRRLYSMDLDGEMGAVLERLMDEGFSETALRFLQNLAAAIHKHQRGHSVVQYTHSSDMSTWKAAFFGPALDIVLLRESSPLTRVNNKHQFIHQCLLDYFYTCHISGAVKDSNYYRSSLLDCRMGNYDSVFSAAIQLRFPPTHQIVRPMLPTTPMADLHRIDQHSHNASRPSEQKPSLTKSKMTPATTELITPPPSLPEPSSTQRQTMSPTTFAQKIPPPTPPYASQPLFGDRLLAHLGYFSSEKTKPILSSSKLTSLINASGSQSTEATTAIVPATSETIRARPLLPALAYRPEASSPPPRPVFESNPLKTLNLNDEPILLQLLSERVHEDQEYKSALVLIVRRAQNSGNIDQEAHNAMNILDMAGITI